MDVNIFDNAFQAREVEFYNFTGEYETGDIRVRTVELNSGRLDGYMHTNFLAETITFPLLAQKMGEIWETWMSLTPMEIQSQFVAIQEAEGECAIGGLGLGYAALAIAEKDTVESVDVYEMNSHVIRFFNETFSERDGFDRINIIEGDVREKLVDKDYDFVYMDIYQTVLPNEVAEDAEYFQRVNRIGEYRFWGEEQVIYDAFQHGLFDGPLRGLSFWERIFFQDFMNHEASDLYRQIADEDFCITVLQALGRENLPCVA